MVECRISFRDGRTITKSVPLDDGEALENLSKGLSILQKEVNSVLTEQVDKEKAQLAKGCHKRPSSTEEDDDDGKEICASYITNNASE